jgi:hypothetical protein
MSRCWISRRDPRERIVRHVVPGVVMDVSLDMSERQQMKRPHYKDAFGDSHPGKPSLKGCGVGR